MTLTALTLFTLSLLMAALSSAITGWLDRRLQRWLEPAPRSDGPIVVPIGRNARVPAAAEAAPEGALPRDAVPAAGNA